MQPDPRAIQTLPSVLRMTPAGAGRGPGAIGFNGRSPGPVLRVRQGRHPRVSLKNSLPYPTAIRRRGLPAPNPRDGAPV